MKIYLKRCIIYEHIEPIIISNMRNYFPKKGNIILFRAEFEEAKPSYCWMREAEYKQLNIFLLNDRTISIRKYTDKPRKYRIESCMKEIKLRKILKDIEMQIEMEILLHC